MSPGRLEREARAHAGRLLPGQSTRGQAAPRAGNGTAQHPQGLLVLSVHTPHPQQGNLCPGFGLVLPLHAICLDALTRWHLRL